MLVCNSESLEEVVFAASAKNLSLDKNRYKGKVFKEPPERPPKDGMKAEHRSHNFEKKKTLP